MGWPDVGKPKRGTPAHRAWLLQVLRDVAEALGRPMIDLRRAQVDAARPKDAKFWPSPDEWGLVGGFSAARKLAADVHAEEELPSTAELGERRGAQRDRLYTARLERQLGDVVSLDERLRMCLADAIDARGGVTVAAIPKAPIVWEQPAERVVCILLSDTHFGIRIDPREVPGSRYDWQTAARRLAILISQACGYHATKRSNTTCRLLLGGDLIAGSIHLDDRGIGLLAHQIDGAAQLLTHAIDRLRDAFSRVDVSCVAGNHDRHTHKGPGRATAQKHDSAIHSIYRGLERQYRDASDVRWDIPLTPYAAPMLCGKHQLFLTHGDGVFQIGNPGRSVDIVKLTGKIHALDASRVLPERVAIVAIGHHHSPAYVRASSGAQMIINGCMSGVDPYAQSIGIHSGPPVQMLWETTSQWAVGDLRQVDVGQGDADERFDAVIPRPVNVDD